MPRFFCYISLMKGTKELTEAVEAVTLVVCHLIKSGDDKPIKRLKSAILDNFATIREGVKGAGQIPGEIGDLTEDELLRLIDHIAESVQREFPHVHVAGVYELATLYTKTILATIRHI